MLLETENLRVKYGLATALEDVSFAVDDRSCVLVVGPNGAGKSTLLRAISGLVRPTEGRILFEGHEIQGLRPDRIVRKGVSHCPERRHLFPTMTVLDNLKLGAYLTRDASEVRRRLEEVSRWFPVLKERLEQRAGTLSGGQQQMLAIGRALMGGPKLLMIDEPSLGLAPKTKAAVLEGIRQVSTAGSVATVLVEQDVLGPSKIAGRMYVLNAGKIAAEGKPEEIISDKEFVRTYLAGVHV